MVSLEEYGKRSIETLNKLFSSIIPKDERRNKEKVVMYLRLYTNLVLADNLLRPETFKRAFDYLKIVLTMTKEIPYEKEEYYIDSIKALVDEVMSQKNKIIKNIEHKSDLSSYAKIKLQLAQNLCVLRILKNVG